MGLGRKLTVVAAAVPTLAALLAAPAGAAGIDWKPCPNATGVDCGTVTVPIDWANPSGGTIRLALARRKATDPAHRIGSVLMDPGGPGGEGAAEVQDGWSLSPAITARFDTVGFDPRGVGRSNPVRCGLDAVTAPEHQLPRAPREFRELAARNRALADSCAKSTGPLADHVDTASVARDIDAIRAALGESRLTYYGTSYGTLMGQEYAERYPDRVRAVVLDGTMDHSLRSTWEFLSSQTRATQEMFDQFAHWCATTSSCALHGQDVHALMASLYSRAERGQLSTPDDPLDPVAFLGMVTRNFYGPSWDQLATNLISLRDGKPAESAYGDITVPTSFASIFCSDWHLPISGFGELQTFRYSLAAIAPDVRFSPLAWKSATGCIGWPGAVRDPQRRPGFLGQAPVLLLNSRYDPATPYEWAQHVSRQTGARLLTYDGAGHGAYFKNSPCVVSTTDRFLIDGVLPGQGTHCAAVAPSGARSGGLSLFAAGPRATGQ
ncbi:alpha/beta hydrolase [Amycolatopsis sp. FDAARGOS 1241]|uniref:alpha/beta hydrolase n=1 Tax=Amycolatopsis sp. FDAARGOS 1241 TaxID=2778070 RepID=UPI00194FF832|nr:alpha/beta hydrolase [Amycolatopsis sp. FDAARGOS 1241]QRP47629.1 alpha/beta fold hydrolase [Amycolatopsis sp. FDAARGOS 1241]